MNVSTTAVLSSRRGARMLALGALVAVVAAMLILSTVSAPRVHADDNLPVYTSPIDITGGRIQLRAVVPDRDTGNPIEVPLPVDLLDPTLYQIMNTPLGTQFDQYWNSPPDPMTTLTRRQMACDGDPRNMEAKPGIKKKVQDKMGDLASAYDVSCNLASTGTVVTKQVDSTLYLSYQLYNNSVVISPKSNPALPAASVSFAAEIWTVARAPAICQLSAGDGTVNLHAVQIHTQNVTADFVRFLDTLGLGRLLVDLGVLDPRDMGGGQNLFVLAEQEILKMEEREQLPLNATFARLNNSQFCTNTSPQASAIRTAFRDVEVEIDDGFGIILRMIHAPTAPPTIGGPNAGALPYGPDTCKQGYVWREAFEGDHVCVTPQMRDLAAADNAQAAARRELNGGAYGPNTCKQGYVWREARPEDLVCVTPEVRDQTAADNAQAGQRRVLGSPESPNFTPPTISAPPVVGAGNSMQVTGQSFPPTLNLATALPLTLDRDATAVCNGGATELEWGPTGGQKQVQRLPADGNASSCAYSYEITNLMPGTAYRFRARDCGLLTCSQWSAPFEVTTEAAGSGKGEVVLTLDGAPGQGDGGTTLGTATVNDQGRFEATVVIPAGTTAGPHAIYAVSGEARARAGFQVTAAGAGGGKATILLTGPGGGQTATGCWTLPLADDRQWVGADQTFTLFGSGFAPGTMTLHLDSATGASLGTATVGADGTFCKSDFRGPPTSQVGDHNLVAVQNGTVQATIPVKIVYPDLGPR